MASRTSSKTERETSEPGSRVVRVALLLALSLLIRAPAARAQILPFEVIGLDRGLPQSQVVDIAQDPEGYIWLATMGGLARYDGETFTQFGIESGLYSDRVKALLVDRTGAMWIATGDGIAVWENHTLRPFAEPRANTLDFAEDRDGGIWIATDQGLFVHRNGAFTSIEIPGPPESRKVYGLATDGDGILAVTTGGLYLYGPDAKAQAIAGPAAPPESFRAAIRAGGDLWLGTEGRGFWRRRGEEWLEVPLGGSSESRTYSLSTDDSGTLYVSTQNQGLYLKAPTEETFRHWGTDNGLPSMTVNCAYQDREKNLWVGTDIGGLARLGGVSVTNYAALPGFPDRCVFGIGPGPSPASLWVGTLRGAVLLALEPVPRVAETITARDGLTDEWVWNVLQTPEGELWVRTDQEAMVRKPGSRRLEKLPEEADFSQGSAFGMALDSEGRLWLCGEDPRGGLLMRDRDGRWHRWKVTEDGQPILRCRHLAPGRGGMWVCTEDRRLILCDGKVARSLPDTPPLPSRAKLAAVFEDRSGRLWVGNDSGLAVREPESGWRLLNDTPGFTNRHVFFIGQDGQGAIWAGTARGVFRFPPEGGSAQALTPEDGLASLEANAGGFYSDPAGSVWFGTVGGLSRYEASRSRPNEIPPRLVVEAAEYRGGRTLFPASLDLSWKERTVTFKVALLAFRNHNRSAYRARLEGLDEDWLPLRSGKELRYTNLPAGKKSLLLQAVNESGVWGEVVKLPISVIPPFWSTWWFRFVLVAALGAIVAGTHRWRVHRLEARNAQLEAVVEDRTRDLRDEKERSEEARRQAEEASRAKGLLLARLEEAQGKIEALQKSSERALSDMAGWARAVTSDVAGAVGAREISVWLLKDGEVSPLSGDPTRTLSWEAIETISRRREPTTLADDVFLPLAGLTGDVVGFLVVSGAPALGTAENRLLSTLARQVGETVELQRMRQDLARAQEARAARRKELAEAGIELLRVCPDCGACFGPPTERCPRDDAPLVEDPGELPVKIRDRYRIERVLGEGGMGRVFAARDERLDRDVALKIVRPEHFGKAEMRMRFEQEARAVARVQHPGVLALFDTGELDDGSTFLVMERLRGRDLASLLATFGPGSLRQVATLVRQAGAALAAAHRAGIVHRDVKPGNLFLVDAEGDLAVKVLDFGLAKPVELDLALTQTGTVIGTPAYMSPEQLQSQPLDSRSDLYSLAAVAFEALTNCRLVTAKDLAEICVEVLHRPPPAAASIRSRVPAEADRILREGLAKDRLERPSSIEEWSRGLAAALEAAADESGGWPLPLAPGAGGPVEPKLPTVCRST